MKKRLITTLFGLLMTVLLPTSFPALPSAAGAGLENNSSPIGYWDNIVVWGEIKCDGAVEKYVSQTFRACYPNYNVRNFLRGFENEMVKACGEDKYTVRWSDFTLARDGVNDSVEKKREQLVGKGYEQLYYAEPESTYYSGCK